MVSVATIASHSALQVLKGAKDEGLRTVLVSTPRRLRVYRRFGFIDRVLVVERFPDIASEEIVKALRDEGAVVVPHGSFVEYVGHETVERLGVPLFGNRRLFRWEASQELKMRLLREAGIRTPKVFGSPEEIDRLVIVKLPGAKGGRGYFLASSPEEYRRAAARLLEEGVVSAEELRGSVIQEYVVGARMYFHYFYSPLTGELELLGMDVRYESNVDGLSRLPERYRGGLEPSFVVVGNIPVVARESLLEQVFDYGDRFVEACKRLAPPGVIGPFSLEAVVTPELDVVVFEFSARIVAGTNLYVTGSPYSALYYDEPMSTGRRIAREIRVAAETGELDRVVS